MVGGRPPIGDRAMTGAERAARHRARKRAENPPGPLAPCGTPARERRHQNAGETCDKCAGARALEQYLRRVINNPDTSDPRRTHFETELAALLAGEWVEAMKQDRPANR